MQRSNQLHLRLGRQQHCCHHLNMSALYEKLPLNEGEATTDPGAPRTSSSWSRKLVAVTLAAILLLSSPWSPSLPRLTLQPHHCDHLTRYVLENISWEKVGEIEGRHLEQSRILVPMDQFNATNSGSKTFNISLIRLRGKDGSPNLLLNPGGKLVVRYKNHI